MADLSSRGWRGSGRGNRCGHRHAHQSARRDIAVNFTFAQTELAKHTAVVFALEGWIAERLEFFAREPPRTARQAVCPAAAIRDFLDSAPILRPFHLGQLL